MPADSRSVILHRGPAALPRLEADWRRLERQNGARFYQGYDWHAAWLEHLEPEADAVLIATLMQGDDCLGLLPLLPGPQTSRWQPRIVEVPRRSGMDLTAPLLAPEVRLADWWPALRAALKAEGLPSFILRLTGVPQETPAMAPLAGMEPQRIVRVQGHSCRFDCRRSYDEIAAGYTTRLKKILRRGHLKLTADGPLRMQSWRGRNAVTEAYPEFLRLEASGWKADSGTALALDEKARRFHEDLLFADDAARLRINLLLAGDRPVAGQLCAVDGGTLSLLKIAFEQACSRASPGSVLLDQLLQHGCDDEAIDTIDLVTGQPWMREWGADRIDVADVWLFDRALTARLVRGAAGLRDRLRQRREAIG